MIVTNAHEGTDLMPGRRKQGRTPDTACLLAALTFVGFFLSVTGNVPISVRELVPFSVALLWQATFTLAAALSLVGLYWRDPLVGWALELSGRIMLFGTSAGYAIAIWDNASAWGTALVAVVTAAIAAGSVGRVWQLVHNYRQFVVSLEAHRALRRKMERQP